jgi:hypothetical protein
MILGDDNHLHIDEQDPIAVWLVSSMRKALLSPRPVRVGVHTS